MIHPRGPWRTLDAVEYATLEWVDWFNNRRLLEPIGNILPVEAQATCYAALMQSAMSERIKTYGLRQNRGGSALEAA